MWKGYFSVLVLQLKVLDINDKFIEKWIIVQGNLFVEIPHFFVIVPRTNKCKLNSLMHSFFIHSH